MAFISGALLFLLASSLHAGRESETGVGEKNGVFVVAGEISHETYGLYLVDYRNKTICVYQYDAGNRNLRLMAARTYKFDVKLDSYNTGEPSPASVRELTGRQNRLGDTSGTETEKKSGEDSMVVP